MGVAILWSQLVTMHINHAKNSAGIVGCTSRAGSGLLARGESEYPLVLDGRSALFFGFQLQLIIVMDVQLIVIVALLRVSVAQRPLVHLVDGYGGEGVPPRAPE
jgi:hypothetical protein